MPDGSPWPKISIVTPSYNQVQYLEETIRSVLLQNYPNLEYIIIDGGSTDGSVEIIKKYEKQLTYWVSEPDQGQSHAINKGFAKSTGEIMAWLNSDDYYASNTLQIVAENLHDAPCSILTGDSYVFHQNDKIFRYECKNPAYLEIFYHGRTYFQPSTFWHRQLFDLVEGVDSSLHYVMDFDLWLRMVPHAKQVIHKENALSYIREHDAQKSIARNSLSAREEKASVSIRSVKAQGKNAHLYFMRIWLDQNMISWRKNNKLKIKGSRRLKDLINYYYKGSVDCQTT